MHKKIVFRVHVFLLLFLLFICPIPTYAQTKPPQIDAASYIIMDFQTGVVLSESQSHLPKPPASMTKMMTAFIILDEIKKGTIKWEDRVTVSQRAAAINEAQVYLMAGDQVPVKDLFLAMVIQSANDATVALAEYVAGSEEKFVQMMNQKAKTLGMKQTHFWNTTGLNKESYPDPPRGKERHEMSAYDTAILAQQLIKQYPEIIQYTSLPKFTFMANTPYAREYRNWNRMLPGLDQYYQGVDGLKTGHINRAGYCFVGTAKRGKMRLITVVMGTKSQVARFEETKKLLDYGFEHFEMRTLLSAGKPLPKNEQFPLPNAVERSVPVVVSQSIRLPVHKEELDQYTYRVHFKKNIQAPINKGTVVGEVRILYRGQEIKALDPIPLIASQDMKRGSWFRLQIRKWGDQLNRLFASESETSK